MKEKRNIKAGALVWIQYKILHRRAPTSRKTRNCFLQKMIKYVEAYSTGKYFWFIANLVKEQLFPAAVW